MSSIHPVVLSRTPGDPPCGPEQYTPPCWSGENSRNVTIMTNNQDVMEIDASMKY